MATNVLTPHKVSCTLAHSNVKLSIPAQRFNALAPKKISAQLLGPLIQWASKGSRADCYGRKVRIADRMTNACGQKVTRQMVSKWLHPNPKKRTQPVMGFGALLLAIGNQVMKSTSPN